MLDSPQINQNIPKRTNRLNNWEVKWGVTFTFLFGVLWRVADLAPQLEAAWQHQLWLSPSPSPLMKAAFWAGFRLCLWRLLRLNLWENSPAMQWLSDGEFTQWFLNIPFFKKLLK